MKATKLGFTEPHGSIDLIEFEVEYEDNGSVGEYKGKGSVKISCDGKSVIYPAHKVSWLIQCLQRIETERNIPSTIHLGESNV